MELKNKNVFVTGSTRGIGLAVAHKFASLGANVVLNGRSEISEDLLAQFADYGVTVVGISGDISNGEDAKRMVAEAIEKLGSVDVLVNNAGITNDKLMLKMTEEDFERVLKINLTGAFNMTQAVLKPMSKARQGAIINMSSVVGLMGNIGQANYAASKAGLIGFVVGVVGYLLVLFGFKELRNMCLKLFDIKHIIGSSIIYGMLIGLSVTFVGIIVESAKTLFKVMQ